MQKGELTHRVPRGWIEIPPATVGVSRQTASENAPAVMEGGLRRQSHALRKVVRARVGEIAGVVEYHGNVAAAIGMNGSEVGVVVVPATGIYDVEVQIIAFRARKIGSKAEALLRRTVVRLSTVSVALRRHQHLPLLKHHRNTVFVCHAPISRKFAEQVG
jgi:hypothetical protein